MTVGLLLLITRTTTTTTTRSLITYNAKRLIWFKCKGYDLHSAGNIFFRQFSLEIKKYGPITFCGTLDSVNFRNLDDFDFFFFK